MFIAGATLVDPPPGEAADTHAYFSLRGAAALRLLRDAEGEGDARRLLARPSLKIVKQLASASPPPRGRRCDFALDLGRAALANGSVC